MTILDNQRGNIFFYILLAVVLFAALSYAVTASLRGNAGITDERRKLVASEIIDTGSRLAEAVNRMRLRGVAKTAISFQNFIVSGYTIGTCTTDNCKVFASEGGGLAWEIPPPEIASAWGYTGALDITSVGATTTPELTALLPGLSAEMCTEINVMLGVHNKTTSTAGGASFPNLTKYPGSFVAGATLNATMFAGKKAGCFSATLISGTAITGTPLSNTYVYYQVLVAN